MTHLPIIEIFVFLLLCLYIFIIVNTIKIIRLETIERETRKKGRYVLRLVICLLLSY